MSRKLRFNFCETELRLSISLCQCCQCFFSFPNNHKTNINELTFTRFVLHLHTLPLPSSLSVDCVFPFVRPDLHLKRSMGLPSMHGSQNMNHIRLMNKLIYVRARYNYLQRLSRQMGLKRKLHRHRSLPLLCAPSSVRQRPNNIFRSRMHKGLLPLSQMRKALPVVSNMPLMHLDTSLVLINSSPFALTDPRFGILHHQASSLSYF